MKYDFTNPPDRAGTGSLKWDRYPAEVLPMWVADMDFAAAPEIINAFHQRADHGIIGYTVPYEAANQVVVDYQKRVHGCEIDPEWLFWIPGMVQGLLLTAMAYAEPGESVMTATPIYPPFIHCAKYAGRDTIEVPLKQDGDNWLLDFDAMQAALRPDTRVFLFCNPHNPVGHVFTRDEVGQVIEFCERNDLVLCSDEIYCDLILDDVPHVPTLSFGERVHNRAFTMMSASKTYNIPGLACAYCIIPDPKLRVAFKKAARGIVTEINCFGYVGAIAAYSQGEAWRQELLEVLRRNREVLTRRAAEELQPLKLTPFQATYLAWLDARGLGLENPAGFFAEHGVALSSGADFGLPGFVRINIGCPTAQLAQALDRMATALKDR